mmetsp:Transcript_8026/g.23984  ORF Transcript_8026/g.23984 Transcript_8026/m.23984 type:complete len:214 (+) Transcript_8026:54-695(+)
MRASTESTTTSRWIVMGRVWPRRCTRPTAWASSATFVQGSTKTTWLACVRLMPQAPARTESRKTVVGGSSWKARRASARADMDIEPESVRYWKPLLGRSFWSAMSVFWNCENTSVLAASSPSRISFKVATRTRSLDSIGTLAPETSTASSPSSPASSSTFLEPGSLTGMRPPEQAWRSGCSSVWSSNVARRTIAGPCASMVCTRLRTAPSSAS